MISMVASAALFGNAQAQVNLDAEVFLSTDPKADALMVTADKKEAEVKDAEIFIDPEGQGRASNA
jgi:hypothetical protein